MGRTPFRIELFGAPRVVRRDEEIRLPVKKSLALLAYLALEGRATRAKLAALFWGDSGADAARRNLRRELHRLREAGLGELLAADDEAVALAAGVACDVAAFEAELDANRAAALSRWHGPLMDGFDLPESDEFDRWLSRRREDLARRYVQAAATVAREREASGDPRAALDLYLHLLQLEPLQESHYAEAMRLAEQLGERSRALELYERCRRTLREQLGLDPLPSTAALAEQIRAAERMAPIVARTGVRAVGQLQAALVGRDAELQQLESCTSHAILIEGEPGVGKSRLALEFALDRAPYLHARGSAQGRDAALQPVRQALESAFNDPVLRARLRDLPAAERAELARLLPQLGDAQDPAEGPNARARFFDAVASALATAGAGGCLVVDDVQWLDDSSLEAIEQLVKRRPGATTAPLRVLLTARTAELAEAQTAREMVRRLERGGELTKLALQPLSEEATLQLVRELSGTSAGHRFARRLQRATQGNPFFLLETIRFLFDIGELALDERGYWSTPHDAETADYAELPVPPTVQKAVLERIERLGPAARRILETAALAGDRFSLPDVQPATALSDWDASEGLERALQAQFLVQPDDAYRFVHDLVRAAVESSLQPERRRLIHKRLAAVLIDRRERPDRIALHLESAGEREQAIEWRIRAAEDAVHQFARTEAIAHYLRALDDGAAGARALSIRIALVRVRRALGPAVMADIAADFAAIDALLPVVDDPALQYRAELLRVMFLMDNGRHVEARSLVDRLLDIKAPTPQDEVRALYCASHCATFGGDAPRAIEYGERGRALALVHDAADLTSIETVLTYSYVAGDRASEAVALADLALARIQRKPLSDPIFRANLLAAAADAHMAAGRYASSEAMLLEALAILQQVHAPAMQVPVLIALGLLHSKSGQTGPAELHRQALADLAGDAAHPRLQYMLAMVDAHIGWAQGRAAAAFAVLETAIAVADALGNTQYQRNARLLRARFHEDLLDFEAAVVDADLAPAQNTPAGLNPVLVREAIHAASEIHHGHAAAARDRLRIALGSERYVDDHVHEARELARVVLAEALLALRDADGSDAALAPPIHTPALRARALAVRLRARADPAALAEADTLLQPAQLHPTAALRLLEALAVSASPDAPACRVRAQELLARWATSDDAAHFAHWSRRLAAGR
jgi:DNA-binding SARP family transcriptional activator